ncbi:MAG: acetoin utilization protein AcuC [Fimbriimonadia bacterium]|jgi:acetoin utilization protein AcuC
MSDTEKRRFFFHPGSYEYDFGHPHPLRPERLRRTLELLAAVGVTDGMRVEEPKLAHTDELLRCHSHDYVVAVERASDGHVAELEFGLRATDNPAFPGMFEASLAYTSASIAAAYAVVNGAEVAFNITGGLHHAMRSRAAGFCIFNDCAIACSILCERFARVAYVDIDLHHGDGVQFLFYDDPSVLTFSIHQDGRSLFPGTGHVSEIGEGPGAGSSVNVPMPPGTTDSLWLAAFEPALRRSFELFEPEAVVLQMGTDPHYMDPLGQLSMTAQGWLEAVRIVSGYDLPLVGLGGGGYNLSTVPRMWTAAVAHLSGVPIPDEIPVELAAKIGADHFFDLERPPDEEAMAQQLQPIVDDIRHAVAVGPLAALESLVQSRG